MKNEIENKIESEETAIYNKVKELVIDSLVSSQNLFVNNITKKLTDSDSETLYKLSIKINDEYKEALIDESVKPNKFNDRLLFLNNSLPDKTTNLENDDIVVANSNSMLNKKTIRENHSHLGIVQSLEETAICTKLSDSIVSNQKLDSLNKIPGKYNISDSDKGEKNNNLVLSLYKNQTHIAFRRNKTIAPEWHAPWKLYRVISGHTGWVRCIDVDPTNNWFVTGSNDRVIKFWDLASGKLKLSLTGHIGTIRQLVVSNRHPYLFSCGEDRQVKCWDLEQNKVVRHYHGHLSGVYSLSLHPMMDIIITGGRDCVARVWDIRSKSQIMVLEGHNNTISSVVSQEFNPQVITGSHDSTIKLWDINMGKCLETLTHHKKSIRSLSIHHEEYTFLSGGCDNVKVWKCPEGRFLRNLTGHNAIVNSIAVNKDNVVVSGADNGTLHFWDYKSGYAFQQLESPVQPGSLSSEAGIFDIKFDHSSTRMITAECDKTIKMWKEDENATPEDFPINQ